MKDPDSYSDRIRGDIKIRFELLTRLEAQLAEMRHNVARYDVERKIEELKDEIHELNNTLAKSDMVFMEEKEVSVEGNSSDINIEGDDYSKVFALRKYDDILGNMASKEAKKMIKINDMDAIAIDDCIILTNSWNFSGWNESDIEVTRLRSPIRLPDELQEVVDSQLPLLQKQYHNTDIYRLYSYRPFLTDYQALRATVAPTDYFSFYSIYLCLDKPVLTFKDGGVCSIRDKYRNVAMSFGAATNVKSPLPAVLATHVIVTTSDDHILFLRRSKTVGFYPDHWTCSIEETMSAQDRTFFDTARRGIIEELGDGVGTSLSSLKALSLNFESNPLSTNVIFVASSSKTVDEIRESWLYLARDKDEAIRVSGIPYDIEFLTEEMISKRLWHPTARMRLLQALFHRFGIEKTVSKLSERAM